MARPMATSSGSAWSIRSVMLLATAMFVLGSETAAAGQPTPPRPSNAPNASSSDNFPTSEPAPLNQSGDNARFTTSSGATDSAAAIVSQRASTSPDATAEQDAGRDSNPEVTLPGEATPVSPAESEAEAEVIGPLARPVVVLYGDSLAWEARHIFEQALADHPVEVITRTFGGTAICDWHDEMAIDAATLRPGLVVIEFVGNNYTPCMQDQAGEALVGDALVDRYAADAETAVALFASIDAQIVFAGAPIARPSTATLDLHRAPLNVVYQELGERLDHVHYVDAGSTVLDDGEWAATLPCLPVEPCPDASPDSAAAANSVRAPDGLHFCPASAEASRGVTGDCPVWSSGAFRYGIALAQPALESLAAISRAAGNDA